MQNKAAIQIFAILLAIACLYHLSFTYITKRVETEASEYAEGDPVKERNYLDSVSGKKLPAPWGWLGFNYTDAKLREINLGLDLKGGMNVTLEVSIPDLLKAMAKNSPDSAFNQALAVATEEQKTSQKNYVDLFVDAYEEIAPNGKLANPLLFAHNDQTTIKPGATNDEVRSILKKEANEAIDRTYEVLNARIDNFGVTQPNIQKLEGSDRILVELPGVQDPEKVQKLLEASAKLEFWLTYESGAVLPSIGEANKLLGELDAMIEDTVVTDSTTALDTTVTSGDPATVADSVRIADSIAAANAPADSNLTDEEYRRQNPLFSVFQPAIDTKAQAYLPGPLVGYSYTFDTAKVNAYLANPKVKQMLPQDLVLAWTQKPLEGTTNTLALIALRKNPNSKGQGAVLGGDVITDASYTIDDRGGGYRVEMKMNGEGTAEWARITKDAASTKPKQSIAIVLDGKVYSYPTVQDPINGGISTITGNFTFDEAKTLASVLKAGKLPTPATIVEQAVVGPSLGQKAISAGLLSLAAAFIVILIYMGFYYGRAGLVADIALFANVFFLVGCLSALGVTLTLPGITGIVLTIGMAVDANVLIYERVREELRQGKGIKLALSDGYKMAYRAIIDSNVTTILIALILMVFGAGPVKGFAVTLFWGILTSMFSAIFISRLIFEWLLKRKHKITFSNKFTANVMTNTNFNFVGRRKVFYLISGLIITAGIVSFVTKGFNLGVDLKGGRSYTVTLDNSNFSTIDVVNALEPQFGSAPIVKYYGSSSQVKIITKYKLDETDEAVEREIEGILYNGLKPLFTKDISLEEFTAKSEFGIAESYKVGPTVARDVTIKSIYAVVLSLVMMFIYILIRFKGWQYALGAIVALAHDVTVVLAIFSIFDGILPFSLEIDQAIIAAVLTVIGYSINDTVIILDRIREFLGEGKKEEIHGLINRAVNSTLSRTINTSLTVLFVLLISFLFGGEAIKGLTFAILIGVVAGTYSSICIATPVVVDLKLGRKKQTEEKKVVKA